MSAPQWADPPPIGGPQDPRSVWMERLRPLVAHPGKWAVVKSGLPSTCNAIANQLRLRQRHVPPGEWEFTVRTFRRGVHVGDRSVGQIYARYIGPNLDGISWTVSAYAAWDDDGRRVCPDCGAVLPAPAQRGGPYSRKCADCWTRIAEEEKPSNQRKWARRLLNRLDAS